MIAVCFRVLLLACCVVSTLQEDRGIGVTTCDRVICVPYQQEQLRVVISADLTRPVCKRLVCCHHARSIRPHIQPSGSRSCSKHQVLASFSCEQVLLAPHGSHVKDSAGSGIPAARTSRTGSTGIISMTIVACRWKMLRDGARWWPWHLLLG